MRAAVLTAPGEIGIVERDVPVPGPGEVLVRIGSVGVCGSDTHYFDHGRIGRFVVTAPLVLGHEAGGVVEAVGPGVAPTRVGERVSIEPGIPDGTCRWCRAGRYNLCPAMRFLATPPVDGAFAELLVVPDGFAHTVPGTVSDDAAALLEPLSVGLWAARKGGITAGSRVLVTGAGPIGLVAVQCALAAGAAEVVVSEPDPARRRVAAGFGATAVTPAEVDGVGPDVLLECSGHPGATVAALRALERGGRAVLVGMGADGLALPLPVVQERELEITATFRYANTWPTAIALVATGRIDLDRLVTGTYPLERAADALVAGRRDPASIKAVVRPQT
ncbi:NAD(P)-dependent alcohol dehydrogenase [Pseudonocardia sp.]|uniref:NAD(P)-dependent alcohol dehydrogenase n=1 Tax=Pseudonocardia sp. TaxID=60912 RepID=UPI003D10A7F8